MPKFGYQASADLQLSNNSFQLIQYLASLSPFNHEYNQMLSNNPNSPGARRVDTSPLLDRESMNAAPLTVREKLVRSILQTYSPKIPQQHQTFTNQKAEELLKVIAFNTSLSFVGGAISRLILELEPPRLQAVLRMTEIRVKNFNALVEAEMIDYNQEDFYNLTTLSKSLAHQLNNTIPDVRKTVVFCLIEVCEAMGVQDFTKEVMEPMLNLSQ